LLGADSDIRRGWHEDRTTVASADEAASRGRGTTLEQRRTLIAAYQRSRNMTLAMREAGIRSPRTAYLWWHRFQADGDSGLAPRSRARKHPRAVPALVAAQACELRRTHPDWGRRKIARELSVWHGRDVVSPSGVETALKSEGLWTGRRHPVEDHPAVRIPTTSHRLLDELIPLVIKGIGLSVRGSAAEAAKVLGERVWSRLRRDRDLWLRALVDPAVGDLLLRSRVQLAHSLMNSGNWPLAAEHLEETIGWLKHHASNREPNWQGPPLEVSLRRDDAWIESYQYLGIVLRDRDPGRAQSYLAIALTDIRSRSSRLVPTNFALAVGNLERDLAKHALRFDTTSHGEVEAHLRASDASLEGTGDRAMLAATGMAWADLHGRSASRARGDEKAAWRRHLSAMEVALEEALGAIEQLDSPPLETNFFVDAAKLRLAHGLPIDEQRLRVAARNCLAYGYQGQARQLLDLPGIERWLSPETLSDLTCSVLDAERRSARSVAT
jgi:hypothetical protein